MRHNLYGYICSAFQWQRVGFLGVLLLLLSGCATERDLPISNARGGSCVGCHTSKEQIIASAEPDTGSGGGDSGEG